MSERAVLLHDIARLHTAAHSVETLKKPNFEVLKHPPYSADLAPSDYHGPATEGNGARVACLSAQNFLF